MEPPPTTPPVAEQADLEQEGGMPSWLLVIILMGAATGVIGSGLIISKWRRLPKLSY